MYHEKRVFNRVKLESEAHLQFRNRNYPVRLQNISLKGATIQVNNRISLAKGNQCTIQIQPKGSEDTLNLDALIMYYQKDQIGFQFCENSQREVKHLHRLIESNFDKSE